MLKKIHLYGNDFEVIVVRDELLLGKYRAAANYIEFPEYIGVDYGDTEEEAIDNVIRNILASCSKEVLKNL